MKKNILFIINPISGGKNKLDFPFLVKKYLDNRLYTAEFAYTNRPKHAFEMTLEAVDKGVEVVVAVGGDGTINEVASAILGSKTIMGIIPCGSGNGLARSLGIPLNKKKAVLQLNKWNTRLIDSACLNEYKFFNMAGLGFDAYISHKFASLKGRGFSGYVKTAFSEVINYKPDRYRIDIDGKEYIRDAFMISIANSSQYGNNAHIAPKALLDDGLLDICVIKPFPLYLFVSMGLRMFAKTSEKSRYVEIIKGKTIRIQSDNNAMVHIDGEAINLGKEILINVNPLSLCVLY
ncbi:diacylglycerol/lipid kinase family protein [Arcticibacter eurypsychrophilus]|uniref:diacylglycerol/lipid kinase family protein n=1 Tax=Arcticibacter eurypsychrophilus TaxID=1434752 RepID=UPI00084CEC89|nr:YegS/Rv2252/BmrU family lipid kinase [Arcticibacter eurypsychrophilus]